MESNREVIEKFYLAFKNKNIVEMQNCYADTAIFSDPIFHNLNAEQVRAMWEMLIKSGKDMRLEIVDIQGTDEGGMAEWTAYYTFSATGNKVVNHVKASFLIANGKIIKHTDSFSFYKWARQALGIAGILLGWSSFLRNKVAKKARNNLDLYMVR